ncbi:polyprenol monophosphomannose synthase [Candidatus Margulisiibacteriota bacterium]
MLSIIVPTYNERKNIEELTKRVFNTLKPHYVSYELIIVDDNSPDGTAVFAESLKSKYDIKVISRPEKISLASAVISGFKAASGNIFCVIDADLSHPPEALFEMYKMIDKEGADVVVGSRLVSGGGAQKWPWYRKIVSMVAQSFARPLTKVKDNTSGFFMLKKEVVDGVKLNPIGFKILLEVLAKGNYDKAVEYPIIFADREGGKSKLGVRQVFEYLKQLGLIYLDAFKKRREH